MAYIVSAVTAVSAAFAVTTVATVLTAVATVGAAMSVVGLVTGSKELTKIGGTLGLVGGIGSLANSAFTGLAGVAGEAGVAEGAAAAAGSDVAGEQFALSAGQDAAGSGFIASGSADGLTGLGNAAGATTSAVAQPAASLSQSVTQPAMTGATQPPSFSSDLAGAPASNSLQPLTTTPTDPITAATSTPTAAPTLSDSILGDVYSDVKGEQFSIGAGQDAAGSGFAPSGSMSPLDSLRKTLGDGWGKLSPQTQAELTKSVMAIPGGIQNQKNTEAALALQQQKINQTSHGSEVPTFGILQKAMMG